MMSNTMMTVVLVLALIFYIMWRVRLNNIKRNALREIIERYKKGDL